MKRMILLIAGIAFGGFRMIAAEPLAADDGKSLGDPTKQLFVGHCQKCHSGTKPKGDFKIENLTPDFSDRKNREQWLTVLEQLKTGEMPPKDKPRPPAKEVQAAVNWISGRAGAAELARRATEGRVVLRRLNRAEYANTVRDLLGVEVDLTDLLPPDTSVSGFDNSAEALHTSSYLMRSYLDAADRVLDEAIANTSRPYQIKKVFDIREEKSVKPTGSVYRHVGDGVAIFAAWESANIRVTMWNFRSHVRGKYRFRISGYGFQSEGKPVNFRVTAGTLKEVTEERLIDYFAVPAEKPTVIEFTEQLEPENRIRIIAEGLPALPPAVEKVGADKYKGPGLVIQWVEIEGPLLASWPPPSHLAIFGNLKQAVVPSCSVTVLMGRTTRGDGGCAQLLRLRGEMARIGETVRADVDDHLQLRAAHHFHPAHRERATFIERKRTAFARSAADEDALHATGLQMRRLLFDDCKIERALRVERCVCGSNKAGDLEWIHFKVRTDCPAIEPAPTAASNTRTCAAGEMGLCKSSPSRARRCDRRGALQQRAVLGFQKIAFNLRDALVNPLRASALAHGHVAEVGA